MQTRLVAIGAAVVLAGAAGAFAKKPAAESAAKPVATAKIEAKSGSKVTGNATFTPGAEKGSLKLVVTVEGATPGEHAVHIHEKGDCSSPDGKSAGDHWNPTSMPHGKFGEADMHFHLGDIGNMTVAADGKGTITLETTKWTASGGGTNDVIGHAIIVHGGVDDFKTQPTGNAGPRIGCGVITK